MTRVQKKDSFYWIHELVEAVKSWRATFPPEDLKHLHPTLRRMADAVEGYRQAIEDEVEAELDSEEKGKD